MSQADVSGTVGFSAGSQDDWDRVDGQARFVGDVHCPDALEVAFVLSTEVSARIRGVDLDPALRLPGVVAAISGADIGPFRFGRAIRDYPVLALDRVSFLGQRVAAVAAVDLATATRAAALVEVDYERLDPILDVEASTAAATAVTHPDYETFVGAVLDRPFPNAQGEWTLALGDAAAALASAEHVFTDVFTFPRQHAAPIEPHACVVAAGRDEVHVYSTHKEPYAIRRSLAELSGRPESEIVVHGLPIGGDFGSKGFALVEGACYVLSVRTGRPVRAVMSYYEELTTTGSRHPMTIRLTTGVRDGRLSGHTAEFVLDGGAFAALKAVPRGVVPVLNVTTGPYHVADRTERCTTAYTNSLPGSHVRAPGEFQASFAGDAHVDRIAKALGEDSVEFRLRNAEDPHVEAILVRLRDLERAWRADLGPDEGLGISLFHRDAGPGDSKVICRAALGEGVEFSVATPDQGAGGYTVFRKLAARALGVGEETVRIRHAGAVSGLADSGAGASRVTTVGGRACVEAARALVATFGGPPPEGTDGMAWVDDGLRRLGLDSVEVTGTWSAAWPPPPDAKQRSYGGLLAHVEVDRQTGVIEVRRALLLVDAGTVVNPVGHRGQLEGGFVYGLSQTLYEDLVVEEGQIVTASLGDYKLAGIADIPPLEISLIESEVDDPDFYGVLAVGELAHLGVAPAIANAIDDAVGVRVNALPITAERVWQALRAAEGNRAARPA